jgi:hypothetical protein
MSNDIIRSLAHALRVQERGECFQDEIIRVQTAVIKKLYEVNTVLRITIVGLKQRVEELDGKNLV